MATSKTTVVSAGSGDIVQIEGLKEFIAALKESPDRLDKSLRAAFRDISKDVRDKARTNAAGAHPSGGSNTGRPHKQHWSALVNAITSGADSDTPWVKVGSERVPWTMGYEYGSDRYKQFPPHRGGGGDAGYFFWPAVRESGPEFSRKMLDAVDAAFEAAFSTQGAQG